MVPTFSQLPQAIRALWPTATVTAGGWQNNYATGFRVTFPSGWRVSVAYTTDPRDGEVRPVDVAEMMVLANDTIVIWPSTGDIVLRNLTVDGVWSIVEWYANRED